MMRFRLFSVVCLSMAFIMWQIKNIDWPKQYPVCQFEQLHTTPHANLTIEDIVYKQIKKRIPVRMVGRKQQIPYVIHQTNEFDRLPADMVLAMETVIEKNP